MKLGSVLVLGAGPAGLSAVLWLKNLGLDFVVLEQSAQTGGMQNYNFLANDWVLGQTAQTGPMLAEKFAAHVRDLGARIVTGVRLDRIEPSADNFLASFENSTQCFDAILIATGTRYRAAEVIKDVHGFHTVAPGQIAYGPYAFARSEELVGKRILIVGGGDNAYENARQIGDYAAMIHLAIRSRGRAQQFLADAVSRAEQQGKCRVLQPARVTSLTGGDAGVAVELAVGETVERITVDRIHVLTGYEPNTRFIGESFSRKLADAISLDAQGYIKTDAECRTGCPNIYAAGDVSNPVFPCVVSAVSQGALAAKTMERDMRSALKS